MIKTSLIIVLIIFILTTWATTNVCKYNYVLNKKAETIEDGIDLAKRSIDSKAALKKLEEFIEESTK